MKLVVTERHLGEGVFPTFPAGTKVVDLTPCVHYKNWASAVIDGYNTYLPIDFVDKDVLVQPYNPTELVLAENSIVELLEVVYDWALVKDKDGHIGWLPFSILKSLAFAE